MQRAGMRVLLRRGSAQKVYERAGRYTPEGITEIMSGFYG